MSAQDQGKKEASTEKSRSANAIGFGTSFAVGMVLFTVAGRALDAKTGHEHLFTLIGIGLGFLYGAWELWKMAAWSNPEIHDEEHGQKNSGKEHHGSHPS